MTRAVGTLRRQTEQKNSRHRAPTTSGHRECSQRLEQQPTHLGRQSEEIDSASAGRRKKRKEERKKERERAERDRRHATDDRAKESSQPPGVFYCDFGRLRLLFSSDASSRHASADGGGAEISSPPGTNNFDTPRLLSTTRSAGTPRATEERIKRLSSRAYYFE